MYRSAIYAVNCPRSTFTIFVGDSEREHKHPELGNWMKVKALCSVSILTYLYADVCVNSCEYKNMTVCMCV